RSTPRTLRARASPITPSADRSTAPVAPIEAIAKERGARTEPASETRNRTSAISVARISERLLARWSARMSRVRLGRALASVTRSNLPPIQRRAPGDAAAERARQHEHPGLQHALARRLREPERDRRGGGVAEALDRAVDALARDAERVGV